jgi:ATP-dependent DNA ligase
LYGEVGGNPGPTQKRSYSGLSKISGDEQAKREAERDWIKQLDKEYRPKTKEGKILADKIFKAKKDQGNMNTGLISLFRPSTSGGGSQRGTVKNKEKKPSKKSQEDDGSLKGYVSQFLPMHCATWADEPKVLKYFNFDEGVYIQPKLDGIRCFARKIYQDGACYVVLTTRQGKQLSWLKHIRLEVKTFLSGEHDSDILDCEVYAEHLFGTITYKGKSAKPIYSKGDAELSDSQKFDVINGICKTTNNPHPLEEQLCLHVFDIADSTGKLTQDERFQILDQLFNQPKIDKRCPHIRRVETKIINYQEEIKDYHDDVFQQGYEGVVIRSRELKYESHKRSLWIRKYKYFTDSEFQIVGAVCDEGVEREHFRWICETEVKTSNGKKTKRFNVKPDGSRKQKQDYYDHYEDYIGKLLTVKYQQLTNEGIPRFPVGKTIRDYE